MAAGHTPFSDRPAILKEVNIRVVVSLDSAQPVRQLVLDLLLQRGMLLRLDQPSFSHEGIELLQAGGIGLDRYLVCLVSTT